MGKAVSTPARCKFSASPRARPRSPRAATSRYSRSLSVPACSTIAVSGSCTTAAEARSGCKLFLPGDLDGDDTVDGSDQALFAAAFCRPRARMRRRPEPRRRGGRQRPAAVQQQLRLHGRGAADGDAAWRRDRVPGFSGVDRPRAAGHGARGFGTRLRRVQRPQRHGTACGRRAHRYLYVLTAGFNGKRGELRFRGQRLRPRPRRRPPRRSTPPPLPSSTCNWDWKASRSKPVRVRRSPSSATSPMAIRWNCRPASSTSRGRRPASSSSPERATSWVSSANGVTTVVVTFDGLTAATPVTVGPVPVAPELAFYPADLHAARRRHDAPVRD